ncbi:hypothetical protein BDA96_10G133100 [Sorghum bicolor]|uniref:Uncharacterized protein n=1 Tax=Sorghum bicolor TaxID=4558 RepID=A0A921U0J7_SORBI|nr:hypothetical protein BDA96_10G133000 [Sorghum bicolor]KAG0513790.1 hypothetical protein BDA96_10G133100 [Sorghum bicolor]
MAAAYKSWPLNKVTDAAHWDAKDLFSRLCIVGDAAFLSSGFLPCDVPETTPWSVSSRYSVPQLAHREGADAAVLCISRLGRRRGGCGHGKITVDVGRLCIVGDVAFLSSGFLSCDTPEMTPCNERHLNARRERLPLAAFAPVLSCGMDDAARALTMSSSSPPDDDANGDASWLWKLFADQLCRRLFLSICHHSYVPLHVADDVATVECASKELRCLVADHDAMLWKARYESIKSLNSHRQQRVEYRPPPIFSNKEPPYFTDEDMPLMSWKERKGNGVGAVHSPSSRHRWNHR